jgi:hypothetical protein
MLVVARSLCLNDGAPFNEVRVTPDTTTMVARRMRWLT